MSRVLTESEGSNGNGPSEATVFKHWKAMKTLASRLSALGADKKKAKAAAEDDGVLWADLEAIDKMGNMALTEQIQKHNRQLRMRKILRDPMAQHLHFIDETLSDETGLTDEQRQKKWNDIGFVASIGGSGLDVAMEGHDPNADTGRWIREGWEAGQAQNAKGIKEKPKPAPAAAPAAEKAPAAEDKIVPKDEPEVVAAKRRGRPPKAGAVYWHNAELKKVYEVTSADKDPDEGAVKVTKAVYDELLETYSKKEDDDWEQSAPPPEQTPTFDAVDDGFDTPPDPE